MAYFLISYDQHKDRDYTPIWTALGGAGAVRVLESVWLLNSTQSAAGIRDSLRQITKSEDSLAVIELKPGLQWACFAAKQEGTNWLTQYFP